jgi:hypothetical protein
MTDADEFRLKIEAYTPETMPMERLAAYLSELAEMLGEGKSVHFVRLEPGSTSIIHKIEREAVPKVKARTNSLRRGIGPRDSVRAYRKINKMLREDNGSAVWKDEKTAADIIIFPGRDDAEEQVNGITQRSSIDGEVVRIGGMQNIVPIMLKYEQDELTGFSGCWASKSVAKDLAKRLFEPVRLFGTGKWNRNDEGIWKLDVFRVDSFEALKIDPLSVAINELRSIQGGWESSSYEELAYLRGGIEGQANGSA